MGTTEPPGMIPIGRRGRRSYTVPWVTWHRYKDTVDLCQSKTLIIHIIGLLVCF